MEKKLFAFFENKSIYDDDDEHLSEESDNCIDVNSLKMWLFITNTIHNSYNKTTAATATNDIRKLINYIDLNIPSINEQI